MAHADWRFVLASSFDRSHIGELTQARGKTLDLVLNRSGACRFAIPMTDELAPYIKPIETCILAYRDVVNGVAQLRWSGPVWQIEESLPAGMMAVSAVGWFEELNAARLLRVDANYSPTNPTGPGGISKAAASGSMWKASEVARDLLAYANAQKDTGETVTPTKIQWGSFTNQNGIGDMDRAKSWPRGTRIGAAITEFSDLEAGYDMEVKLDASRVPRLYLYDKKQTNRIDVVFGYNTGARNLAAASRTTDGGKLMNRMVVQGKYGSALVENQTPEAGGMTAGGMVSTQRFGIWEEWVTLSDVVDSKILLAYGGAEILLRSYPQITFSLQPFPYSAGDFVPKLFRDYDIGDLVYFSVRYGTWQMTKQAVRVFGVSISISDEGAEQISNLMVYPGG